MGPECFPARRTIHLFSPDCLQNVPFTGSQPHRRDLGYRIEGQCTRGLVLHTGQGGTSLSHLEWLTITGVRTRTELNARIPSQATRAAGRGCGDRAPAGPRLVLLMEGSLAGGDTSHICSLEVSRAGRCRGLAGALAGGSQGTAGSCGVRRWWCARAVNHVFVGWGFEGAEEAKVKQ